MNKKESDLLIRIDERQNAMLNKIESYHKEMKDKINALTLKQSEHERSINSLQSWKERLSGGWGVIVIAAVALSSIAGLLLSLIK